MAIDERSEIFAKHVERIERNRDVIAGTRAVKKAGTRYLPYAFKQQAEDDESYQRYKMQVPFYPAASRAHDGFMGMAFRKEPVAELPPRTSQIKSIITNRGDSLERLAKYTFAEAITGHALLVTDHPASKATSLATAIDEGIRPFINLYKFEHILEYTVGIVRNMQKPIRVRLLDNDETVRLYKLDKDGFVVIELYKKVEGSFPPEGAPTQTFKPTDANGNRIVDIPVDPVSLDGEFHPTTGPLDNVVETNLDHYLKQGQLTVLTLYGISPFLFFSGVERGTDIDWVPGGVFCDPEKEAKPYVVSVPADHAIPLEHQLQSLEDRLATLTSRILARHKPVAEAAETEAMRQGAENSVLAMIANSVSEAIEKALQRVAMFLGEEGSVRFQINTDYIPANLDANQIKALLELNQAGRYSDESLFYKLRDGGQYDETLTYDEEKKRIAASTPVEVPVPPTGLASPE